VRITCVGGGPAGLYFSLLMKLRHPGHDIRLIERNATGAAHGWGVTLGQDVLETLRGNDAVSAQELERAALHWTRQVVRIGGSRETQGGYSVYNIARQSLVDILARRASDAGVRIDYGYEVTRLADVPPCDLIVAADGAGSQLRSAVAEFGTSTRLSGNKYIWLGSGAPFDGTFNYIFASTRCGWVWAYAYQFDIHASTFIVECSPQTWAGLGLDVMPTDEAAVFLGDVFSEHLNGRELTAKLPDGTLAKWLDFRIITNHRWHVGNLVLAGDSAHTAHYSLGQGTKMALEDAIALADSLQRHAGLEAALTEYETRRKAELVRPLSEARCSAEWFENLPRYSSLKPRQFAVLLQRRWSPLIRVLPPRLSYLLHQVTKRITVLNWIRSRVGPAIKTAYARRYQTAHIDGPPSQ
jgi:2-polyprenyl-6-methoxyphenol hydroxylase-like FAD-dependent oxidoreductase